MILRLSSLIGLLFLLILCEQTVNSQGDSGESDYEDSEEDSDSQTEKDPTTSIVNIVNIQHPPPPPTPLTPAPPAEPPAAPPIAPTAQPSEAPQAAAPAPPEAPPTKTKTKSTNRPTTRSEPPEYRARQYMGCYRDKANKRAMMRLRIPPKTNTIDNCKDSCYSRGSKFSGTVNGKKCFCSNTLPNTATYPKSSRCNKKCKGDRSQICGGHLAISVYATGK